VTTIGHRVGARQDRAPAAGSPSWSVSHLIRAVLRHAWRASHLQSASRPGVTPWSERVEGVDRLQVRPAVFAGLATVAPVRRGDGTSRAARPVEPAPPGAPCG
jgi:hypothetical protein